MCRRAALCLVLIAAVLASMGCASTMQPRTSAELQYKDYKKLGAVVDASRAYPLAFYAEHSQKPAVVAVDFGLGGAQLQAGQWLAHLAARMNQALLEVGLFDARFRAFSQQVFHNAVHAGDYVYDFKDFNGLKRDIELSGARLVKIRLVSAVPATVGAVRVARVTVELMLGGLARMYRADSAKADWDADCFAQIGRQILADPGFWKVIRTAQ